MVVPEYAVSVVDKLAQNLFISMSTMAQFGALAGFEAETQKILKQRRDVFHKRRDFLLPALRDIGFQIPHTPDGALYIYANCQKFSH